LHRAALQFADQEGILGLGITMLELMKIQVSAHCVLLLEQL